MPKPLYKHPTTFTSFGGVAMEVDDFIHDAFTTNHLWKRSAFFQETDSYESSLFAPLQLDVPSIKFHHPYAPKETLDRELRLPGLDSFEFGQLPELESLDESSISLETLPTEPEEDDLWQVALDLGPADKDVKFFTWERFENPGHVERPTPYVSEFGATAFDAVLTQDEGKLSTGRIIGSNILLESLWNLGLGRSSLLFSCNPKSRVFEPAIPDGRASGISLRGLQGLINQFIYTGNTFLYLRSFVERTFASASSIPARVALATSISSILTTFEDHLGRHSGKIQSLLQLQRLFAKPRVILSHIARMVDSVKHTRTNEQLSSTLHQRMLEFEEGDEHLRRLSSEILRRVAKPSLELLGEWIGIQKEQEIVPIPERSSFVAVEDNPDHIGPVEYAYRSEMMPKFISPEDGSMIFETGNSLRFLKLHHPNHPLASLEKFGVQPPELEWKFGWRDIETISSKAKEYEQSLRTAILEFSQGASKSVRRSDTTSLPSSTQQATANQVPGVDYENYFENSIRTFDAPPSQPLSCLPNELLALVDGILLDKLAAESPQTSDFSPPLSITSALSFRPLLAAQAKLVNATTLRLFFRSHQLRLHLSLQKQYHLLGDGVFSSRLASALFDPERESAERHKGKMRSGVHMGLQLGTRTSWPPASSELRLALMGVLSESYYSSVLYYSTQTASHPGSPDRSTGRRENDELPGQLNFAVRQLNEREMEKIMDPDALYALDFLRLQYVPPSPLNLVITSAALDKYDTIFKFLLRLLRMVFVISHLPRQYEALESRQFRMEAHHFVTALSNYIFQTGLSDQWNVFQTFVNAIETRLQEEDDAGELGTRVTEGIASLRDAHEKCLDSIMFSLLLRGRQRKIMALVEEIFDYILLFAKTQNPDAKADQSVQDLYAKMKGKIRVFLSVCRGLTGKKGYGMGKGTAEENSIERLVVSMEMNGYFAR